MAPDKKPFPLTVTVTGFSSGSLDGMSKLSQNEFGVVGEKRTVRGQLANGEIVSLEQLSVSLLNGAASGFACPILPITRSVVVPSLVTVTVWSDELPCVTLPKGI